MSNYIANSWKKWHEFYMSDVHGPNDAKQKTRRGLAARALVLLLALVANIPAQAEVLQGLVNVVVRQPNGGTNAIPSIWMEARDGSSPSTGYQVRVCVDDSSRTCTSGNVEILTCNLDYPNITVAGTECYMPIGTIGAIDLKDGKQHYIYPWAISHVSTPANDILIDYANYKNPNLSGNCCGFPVRWDSVHSNLAETYVPPSLASSTPATAGQFAILVDTGQSVSTGTTSGNLVCAGGTTASGSTAIYDDGLAGIWMKAHGAACSQVFEAAVNGSASIMTEAAFNAAWGTQLTRLPATFQYIAVAWFKPNIISGPSPQLYQYGLSGFLTMLPITGGGTPAASACLGTVYGLGQAEANPWFNSGANSTPLTTAHIRPTIMLAAAVCPTCTHSPNATNNTNVWNADGPTFKSLVTAATAAIGSNPGGMVAQLVYPAGEPQRVYWGVEYTPQLNGTAISPDFTMSLLGSAASPVAATPVTSGTLTNNILYGEGSASWTYDSTFGFKAGAGVFFSLTSTAGGNDLNQTPLVSAFGASTGYGAVTGVPAVGAGGTAVEPCQSLTRKEVDPYLFLQYYTAGFDFIQSFYKAMWDVWGVNAFGDPLAQPFRAGRRHS